MHAGYRVVLVPSFSQPRSFFVSSGRLWAKHSHMLIQHLFIASLPCFFRVFRSCAYFFSLCLSHCLSLSHTHMRFYHTFTTWRPLHTRTVTLDPPHTVCPPSSAAPFLFFSSLSISHASLQPFAFWICLLHSPPHLSCFSVPPNSPHSSLV